MIKWFKNKIYRIKQWYNKLWFMKLSRDFANSVYFAERRGIDFGMPIEEIAKYYCRDHGGSWKRFFLCWKEIHATLDWRYHLEQYE